VLLSRPPESQADQLSFEPSSGHLLNLGTTDKTIVVLSAQQPSLSVAAGTTPAPVTSTVGGDDFFLASLPSSLVPLGEQLLAEVRRRWPGELQHHPTSKRFVESPDNFWTVKIQPRDRSLRITVRGEPSRLGAHGSLDIKRDQNGYSTFKVSRIDEVASVISLLSCVRRR
jgi:hypothetical protein